MSQRIKEYLVSVADFREPKKCKHRLSDILIIGLCTYLSNGQDYEDMALFAQTHGSYLTELVDLPNGIPSHDTFRRVFQFLDSKALKDVLTAHGKEMLAILAEKQICIDGKKLRGVSPTTKGNKGLYIVNAWVGENRLCVGQERVADKSNEITAIPTLLSQLDLTDAVVSIDAMGCQTEIAQQICDQKGHYLLALKANQGDLFDEVSCAFRACKALSSEWEWEYGRNRFETRRCSILCAGRSISDSFLGQWSGLETLVKIDSTRLIKGKTTTETRYYLSDESSSNPIYFNKLARGHWGIENHLHWHLDVTFQEDACRVRTGNSPENLATLRKFALQIIAQQKDKLSLKKRRVKAAYDVEYLKELLL
jgi:predicted transposase YbfD/YdcC